MKDRNLCGTKKPTSAPPMTASSPEIAAPPKKYQARAVVTRTATARSTYHSLARSGRSARSSSRAALAVDSRSRVSLSLNPIICSLMALGLAADLTAPLLCALETKSSIERSRRLPALVKVEEMAMSPTHNRPRNTASAPMIIIIVADHQPAQRPPLAARCRGPEGSG